MSDTTQEWLVCGQQVLASHAELWNLCRACEALLGEGRMVIAEYALGNCIEPWDGFFPKKLRETKWSRGRLFGADGEIQWRVYGRLVRVVVLVDGGDAAQGQALVGQLQARGVDKAALQVVNARTGPLYLETNDDTYTAATVRSYGDEGAPSLFVRYCGVTMKSGN